jgi:outer membrane lipase/esterase
MQAALAAIARNGVRVELVDISLIGTLIKANPALYGISNTGTCPLTCIGNPALQNQYLFYFDGVHLTSHGFAIVGEYIVSSRAESSVTCSTPGSSRSARSAG